MSQDDEDEFEVGPPGTLGRVRHVSDDGRQITIELRGGQVATATSNDPTELCVGNVVTVRDHALDRVPDELWVEQTWVGVVKIKRSDRTVIDGGGRWQLLPTNDAVEYAVGNTVEVSDSTGVIEVLHLTRSDSSSSVSLTSRSWRNSRRQPKTATRPSTTSAGCRMWSLARRS